MDSNQTNQEDKSVSTIAEDRVLEFNNWVIEKLNVAETFLQISELHCQYYLSHREQMSKELFESNFNPIYICINKSVSEAKWRASNALISQELLDAAVESLKQMKTKVRKEKAKYKLAFAELREAMKQSMES